LWLLARREAIPERVDIRSDIGDHIVWAGLGHEAWGWRSSGTTQTRSAPRRQAPAINSTAPGLSHLQPRYVGGTTRPIPTVWFAALQWLIEQVPPGRREARPCIGTILRSHWSGANRGRLAKRWFASAPIVY
jgi:hypothetical protein